MDWKTIAEIAITFSAAVGGGGAVFIGIVKWASNIIADRLSKKYEMQMTKEIEQYKAEVGKKQHVSIATFDAEFAIYRDLCKAFSEFLQDLFTLIPISEKSLPDRQIPMNPDEYASTSKEIFFHALSASAKSKDLLTANKPFIPKEIVNSFYIILDLTDQQLIRFSERYNKLVPGEPQEKMTLSNDDFAVSQKIWEQWNAISDSIRDYLRSLEIVK